MIEENKASTKDGTMAATNVTIELDHQDYLTINQVAHLTKISIPTLRRYIRDYKQCLSIEKGLKNKALFSRKAIEQFVAISHLVRTGHSRKEVIASITDTGLRKQEARPNQEKSLIESGGTGVSQETNHWITVIKQLQEQMADYQAEKEKVSLLTVDTQRLRFELEKERQTRVNLEKRMNLQEVAYRQMQEQLDGKSLWESFKVWIRGQRNNS